MLTLTRGANTISAAVRHNGSTPWGPALLALALLTGFGCGGGSHEAEHVDQETTKTATSETSHDHGHEHGNDPAATTGDLSIYSPSAQLFPSTGAVYFHVMNSSEQADRLVRIETPAAAEAQTHESTLEGDVMKMVEHPDGFEIPANGSLTLEPGGKHVMLVSPSVAEGSQTLPLTLHFERSEAVEIVVPVSQPGEGESHGGEHHHG